MKLESLIELQKKMERITCDLKCSCVVCEHSEFCTAHMVYYRALTKEIEERQKYNK